MNTTENPTESLITLYEKVEIFGKTTYELSKLKSLETTTVVATTLIEKMSVVLMLGLFLMILNVGIALLIGEALGKLYYGFFIISGFYLLVAIVLYFNLNRWIKRPISELIISQALR
jgi:hypothetical protein